MHRSSAVVAAVVTASVLLVAGAVSASEIVHPTVVSQNPSDVTPQIRDDGSFTRGPRVLAITTVGSTTFAGGEFHRIAAAGGQPVYDRDFLVAFDSTTGAVRAIAPRFDGAVWAVEPSADGSSVFVGGAFRTVNDQPYPGLVKLDATTGAIVSGFDPSRGLATVRHLEQVNGQLIAGGSFGRYLLSLNPGTGAVTNYIDNAVTGQIENSAGTTSVFNFAVDPAGTRLVAVGSFTTVDGQPRRRAFMLNLGATGSTLNDWYYQPLADKCLSNNPVRQAYLNDVDFSPSGAWFVLVATGYVPELTSQIGTHVCDAAARFETGIAHQTEPTWINYTGGDTLTSAVATRAAVYVQGHIRWLDNPQGKDSAGPGSVNRAGIGAIDPVTGKALSWNPGKPSNIGGYGFHLTPQGLWVGSESRRFGGEAHWGIAFAPLP